MTAECDDGNNPDCSCIPLRSLTALVPGTSTWGCSLCPGACPDGDFAKGGRDSHPALLPENPQGYAPGECGIHAAYFVDPATIDPNLKMPLTTTHIDITIKDANTKQIASYTVQQSQLPGQNIVIDGALPTPLTFTPLGGLFTYDDQQFSFDSSWCASLQRWTSGRKWYFR